MLAEKNKTSKRKRNFNNINLMNISSQIHNLIKSDDFKKIVEKINSNYFNLKQEGVIRNAILELYNERYANEKYRAFAEHPRIEKTTEIDKIRSSSRVDLSIVNKDSVTMPYKIEFKYHFSKHRNDFLNYKESIRREFINRESDMFILVIADCDKSEKEPYDKQWGISTNLSKYMSGNDHWKDNVKNSFSAIVCEEGNCELLEVVDISIYTPYLTNYYFYILKKTK